MLDAVQVQDCKNKQIEQSRAFARLYYINTVYHKGKKSKIKNTPFFALIWLNQSIRNATYSADLLCPVMADTKGSLSLIFVTICCQIFFVTGV